MPLKTHNGKKTLQNYGTKSKFRIKCIATKKIFFLNSSNKLFMKGFKLEIYSTILFNKLIFSL